MKDPQTGLTIKSDTVLDAAKKATSEAIVKTFVEGDFTKGEIDDTMHRVKASLEKIYGTRFS